MLPFFLSPGQISDAKGALAMLSVLPLAKILLGDKGYDADWFREAFKDKGTAASILARRGRKNHVRHDQKLLQAAIRSQDPLRPPLKTDAILRTATTDAAGCSSPPSASPRSSCSSYKS